ncbi:hypothetical protein B0H19DRAFT_574850 [Mycena capillaripes]|nr:hypothetical protein B0H19DRAFT_574850 [Mycena capillaripes]
MSSPVPHSSNPSPFVPTHPFAQTAGADAILRSSDGLDFYVHRTILSLVSPVFETMFSLPQPESTSSVPIIEMQESSANLDRALRFFYPGAHPVVETLNELQEAIEVLMKYDMQCVVPVMKHHLEKYHSSRPLAVYAIAFRHHWKDVAVAAARESLKHALRVHLADASTELEHVTAVAYHNLLQYHARCAEAARSTVVSLKWFLWPTMLGACRCNKAQTTVIFSDNAYHPMPVWFSQYLTSMRDLFAIIPGSDVGLNSSFCTALEQARCDYCRSFNFYRFTLIDLPTQLKAEIDKIELKF